MICKSDERSISYRGEGQDLDVVSLIGRQARNGEEVGSPYNLFLPLVDMLAGIGGVVNPVARNLPISLLGFIPVDDGGRGT